MNASARHDMVRIAAGQGIMLGAPEIVPLEGVPMDAEWNDGALWVTRQAPSMIVKLSP